VTATTALALVLAAAGLLLGGGAALLHSRRAGTIQAVAGGLLLALVCADLLPDALEDGSEAGISSVAVLGLAAVVLVLVWGALSSVGRASAGFPSGTAHDGCCGAPVGRLGASALAAHGIAEGAILGLSAGLDPAAGVWLLIAFCVHKAGEGFAIVAGVALRDGHRELRRAAGWIAIAGASPVAGALLAQRVPTEGAAVPLLTAVVAGVLGAVALQLTRPALRRGGTTPRMLALLSAAALAIVIGIGATGAGAG
jgi:ZIP family zinc transporter